MAGWSRPDGVVVRGGLRTG